MELSERAKKLKTAINEQISKQPLAVKAVAGDALLLVSYLAELVADMAVEVERDRQKQ